MDRYVVGPDADREVERFWQLADSTPLDPERHAIALAALEKRLESCVNLIETLSAQRRAEVGGMPEDPLPLQFAKLECEHQLAEFLAGNYRVSNFAGMPLRLRNSRPKLVRLSECLVPRIQSLLLFRIETLAQPDMFALKDALLAEAEKGANR
ncbi:MAG: hypothetical protein IT454_14990 [Planctomycetes bacterium]|nr:hypothetical protein [Planctomycetota bacterium]